MMKAGAPGGGNADNFQAPKYGEKKIKDNFYSLVHTVSYYPKLMSNQFLKAYNS